MRPTLLLLLAAASPLAPLSQALAAPPTVGGCQVLPADNYWNSPVDALPVHASSATWVGSLGAATHLHPDFDTDPGDGIPFLTVTAAQPLVPITNYSAAPYNDPDIDYSDESDAGPYPIPPTAPVEGGADNGGDQHVLVIETTHCVLYELYFAHFNARPDNSWVASSFAKWPLNSNALRPADWTSADAAGLPIFPGLVRYDEVAAGAINHAIRFTSDNVWGKIDAHTLKYLWPARHNSGNSTNPAFPPMGARFRLKAGFDISHFSTQTQVILTAFKKYGMVLADGGSNWFFQGMSDPRWTDTVLNELKSIAGSNFEAVDTSSMMVDVDSGQAVQPAADVAVTQAAMPNPGLSGKDVAFQMTVTNNGPGAATGITAYASYDVAAAVIWVSPGCAPAGAGLYACTVGTLGNGGTAQFKLVLRKNIAGSTYNNAGVSSANDPNAANNTANLNVTVNASPAGNPILRYRLYSTGTQEHLYTTDLNEYNVLGASGGWTQEGTVGKVLDNPGAFNTVTATPYYRLYNSVSHWHHWTTDPNEYYTLTQGPPWNGEGVDGYILPTMTTGAEQLYRLLYPDGRGLHHWTIDPTEYGILTTTYGWVGEGGAGFVIQ